MKKNIVVIMKKSYSLYTKYEYFQIEDVTWCIIIKNEET